MRLIDADELLKHKGDCYDKDGNLMYAVGTGDIMAAPTVDAEPVRHGRWVAMRDKTLECSKCKSIAPFDADRNGDVVFADEYDYCPWCGAKMDGGEDNA